MSPRQQLDPVAQRILMFRKPGEKDGPFADRIGTSHQNIINWSNGTVVSPQIARQLAEENNWNPHWLLTGEGGRYSDGRADSPFADGINVAVNEMEATLEKLRKLATQEGGNERGKRGRRKRKNGDEDEAERAGG